MIHQLFHSPMLKLSNTRRQSGTENSDRFAITVCLENLEICANKCAVEWLIQLTFAADLYLTARILR